MRARAAIRTALKLTAALLLLVLISACGSGDDSAAGGTAIEVYHVNSDETEIAAGDYIPVSDITDSAAMVEELTAELSRTPDKLEYEPPISGPVELLNFTVNERLLTLNFAAGYSELDPTTEILIRAALVRTYTQIPDIETVAFLVDGNPLTDSHGEVVGNMTSDRFIYNAGREINTYEKVQLTLYFADESGTSLQPVYRTVVYNSNILMERIIVEQLIAGPKLAAGSPVINPTVNPDTSIVNISVRDGICYVNLSSEFLSQPYAVSAEVGLYSIVNSLAELPEVSRVQLLVDGDSSASYMDSLPLQAVYTRNLDIVGQ